MENEKRLPKNRLERINYAQMTQEQRDKFWENYKTLARDTEKMPPDERKGTKIQSGG